MKVKTTLFGLAAALAVTASVSAQSLNVDIGTTTTTAPGFGAPSNAFGGAASSPGFWNDMTGTTQTNLPLLNLAGAASGVTLTRSTAAGGNFAFNKADTSGDFALLLDDGQDLSASLGFVSFTFTGLANGAYDVYTYAVAPDFAADFTIVRISGQADQLVGGNIPVNAFAQGITHALHSNVLVNGGTLTIEVDGDVGSFGTINGIQLVLIPGPGALAVFGLAGLMGSRRRRN